MKKYLYLAGVLSCTALAQAEGKKAGLEKMIQPKVSYESSYLSDAVVDGFSGGAKVSKNTIRINNMIAGLSYTNWTFKWHGIDKLPFGDGVHEPLTQMHSIKLNANIPYFISEKWFWLTSLSLKSTFEKETKDSYAIGFFSFGTYKLDKEHAITVGAFGNYHPTTTIALPALSYSYRARASDGFKVILGFPRSYVGYHINEDLLIRAGFIYSQSVIRLSDESYITPSGFVEAKDYLNNFGFAYELSNHINLETDLLYSLRREFTIFSKDANELNSYIIKPSLGINLRLSYLF
ncbi:hypothetical protein [Sulfurimonas marina]|uniref:Outer membrane protein beta-barrel domain-containing protein n=1 Tax=Sulfurimonas marina TaxID=2590551 RepID=A0A7M1AX49_9BACT|nr:hypothetical protein [Sulfurimonas marina]QOP41158.1 hypothetical protein FJR03_05135 [Sulfurimonas marina]